MRTPRRLVLVLVLVAATGLVACAFAPEPRVTRLPTDAPRVSSSPSPTASATFVAPTPSGAPSVEPRPEAGADCGGQPIVLDAGSVTGTIAGNCPDVQVYGSELVIDAEQATVAVMLVAGDRISVRMGSGAQVTIQGNDVFVDATDISALTVRGDRNTVQARSGIGGVLLQGNDNVVRGTAGQVADEGARNSIG